MFAPVSVIIRVVFPFDVKFILPSTFGISTLLVPFTRVVPVGPVAPVSP
jgi:hypothetical protein